jgi:hypothetical protein
MSSFDEDPETMLAQIILNIAHLQTLSLTPEISRVLITLDIQKNNIIQVINDLNDM